jgi:hypothetical protein
MCEKASWLRSSNDRFRNSLRWLLVFLLPQVAIAQNYPFAWAAGVRSLVRNSFFPMRRLAYKAVAAIRPRSNERR